MPDAVSFETAAPLAYKHLKSDYAGGMLTMCLDVRVELRIGV